MADRVRQMMKRSTSKLSTTKGSVNHIGTTPYRFKVDIFVSYAENIKTVTEACITCERRGKVNATDVIKVKDGKAIFRQPISMECTLFRKTPPKSKRETPEPTPGEQLEFDEKKAKIFLRKGGPQGKAVAKLALNISDYVKGASSTVFADMKLSDGTLVVTKVEAAMLAMEKKKKKGSRAGSDMASEMSDANSVDDSLFEDEDDLQYVQRMADIPMDEPSSSASINLGAEMSPLSISTPMSSTMASSSKVGSPPAISSSASVDQDMQDKFTSNMELGARVSTPLRLSASSAASYSGAPMDKDQDPLTPSLKTPTQRVKEPQMKESPSLKDKLKSKLKSKKDKSEKKDKSDKKDKSLHKSDKKTTELQVEAEDSETEVAVTRNDNSAEVKEIKKALEHLKKENSKLKKAKNAAMEEVEALRAELSSCELALDKRERDGRGSPNASDVGVSDLHAKIKQKDKKIGELTSHNESLLEEMEEQHQELRTMSTMNMNMNTKNKSTEKAGSEVKALKKKISELELALQREPEFMDVVNELKVVKVTLALANMEKEQAIFELQSYRHTPMRSELPLVVSNSDD